jgi:hypothetical protein
MLGLCLRLILIVLLGGDNFKNFSRFCQKKSLYQVTKIEGGVGRGIWQRRF